MSISSTLRKAGPYNGNGSTTSFPFTFKVFQASDLLVVQTDATPTDTTLALNTNYTVSLNANQDSNPGGTVNLIVAPPSGYLLTIGSQVQPIQSVTLTNNGGFYPTVINNALDYVTILIQQISEKLGRALTMPFSTNASGQLPPVSPGSLLGWKQDGSGIANIGASGVGAGGIVASNLAAGATGTALSTDTQAAAIKATPVDADLVPVLDSASVPAFGLKKLTWANLKTALASVFLLQNNPTLGLVETFADPAGARCRRYYDITNLTGMTYNGATINAEYMTVNNTMINAGVWAGRDVAGPCWAEVMTDLGQKLYYYAPSAAAGAGPAWTLVFAQDLGNGVSLAPSVQGAFKNLKVAASGLTNFGAAISADEIALENAAGLYYTARNVSATPAINVSGVNGLDNQSPQTCTISIASPGVVTLNSHGFPVNAPIVFATTGALPTGLVAGTIYYVLNPAANTFQVSATQGGAAINTSGAQSGVQTVASAFAANCWYSVWLMYNGAITSGKLSASATSPVMDAGYAFKARVGWVRTDGTANKYLLQTLQQGRRAQYVVLASSNTPNLPLMASGVIGNLNTPTWAATSTAGFTPSTASLLAGMVSVPGQGAAMMVAPNVSYGSYSSTTNPPPFMFYNNVSSTYGSVPANLVFTMLLETANIYLASNVASNSVWCMGWEDNI
jgi:hypothetical protein